LLDCEELDEATLNAIEGQQDIFYEEQISPEASKAWITSFATGHPPARNQSEDVLTYRVVL
jgi:hypothetical protein